MSFSERYGYTSVSNIIIREQITEPIKNAIINWLAEIENVIDTDYYTIEEYMWQFYFNRDIRKYTASYGFKRIVLAAYIDGDDAHWHEKLNMIEAFLAYLTDFLQYPIFISHLNMEFERHNFAYRVIDGQIEEITSENEVKSIETALHNPNNAVKTHLQASLKHLSVGQANPDHRNSIKESISAVEVYCRTVTQTNTLGDALNVLEKNGIVIHPQLRQGLSNIYNYTNDKKTGIRHALIEDGYVPNSDDAIFMLVMCSAFINYLSKKHIAE